MHKAYSKLEDLCEELGGGFTHQCLQVIQFVGWNGVQTEVQLADYLIKSAPQLEKLILDLRIPESKQTEAGWMSEDYHYSERNWQGRADALLCAKQFEINFQKRFPKARLIIVHRLQSSDTETTSIS
ncbi:OLC1v1028155C1 [Oldenlandia corymbosa var. corymbosa]|uniref:OLC1v1028155C1 n=1 Tax=Oldenlandia corymbosa var. corymbosa TaxID=529605 RepID=A0AAV1CDX6_OLDCO|nr:OLC1v1028155C1 [Oldenlandia corymbosa var. corymbosa]